MREFWAEMVFVDVDSDVQGEHIYSNSKKYYVRENIMRMDELVNGTEVITIYRPDKGVIWRVYPQCMSYEENELLPGEAEYDSEATRIAMMTTTPDMKLIGRELCNGFECDKYESRIDWGGKSTSTTIWVSRRLEHIVKTESKTPTGSSIDEIRDIHEGKLPDSVFEIPQGYTKKIATVTSAEKPKSSPERIDPRKPVDPNLSPQYSADVFQNGKQIGRIFVKGRLLTRKDYALRSEELHNDHAPIMIRRSDYDMALFPKPESRVYHQWSSGDTHWGIGPQPIGIKSMPYALTGSEHVSGYECDVYHVEYTSLGKREYITLWISKHLDNVLRCKWNDPETMKELRNIKEGPLPDDLFDAPLDYKLERDW